MEHKYNRQLERKETKDQNGTVHAFDFDGLGRPIHNRVITLGSGVDGAIRRLSFTYEVRGMLEKATSYDNATVGSGNIVNEVVREYNDLGLLSKEYQEHDGAKDGNTLYVGYNYDETVSSGEYTKGLRPTSLRYPDGRLIHYTSEDRDRYKYGYNRASNRTYRENTLTSGKYEYYSYDGLQRLQNFDRGDLNADKTAITGTPVREEDFTLDPLGNWNNYVQKTSGTTDLDQDRTHNKANEITNITETTGASWVSPAYDRAGNATTFPQPSSPVSEYTALYDAWNRVVNVAADETTVVQYSYNAIHRRASANSNSLTHDIYQSDRLQFLEERERTATSAKVQYVWGIRYVDALILRERDTTEPANGTLDERIYETQDANGNVTALLDSSGAALERFTYQPYGELICSAFDGHSECL